MITYTFAVRLIFFIISLLFIAYGRSFYMSRAPRLYKGCMLVAGLAWVVIFALLLDSIDRVPLGLWFEWFVSLTVICLLAGMAACSGLHALAVLREKKTD
jgi:predicted membrane protein